MEIRMDVGINELYDMAWSGGKDTLDTIYEHDKEEELMNLLEEVFFDEIPSDTEVNDFLWFERDMVYEHCGLDENGEEPSEEPSEEDIEKSIENLKSMECFEDFCDDCEKCVLDFCRTLDDCVNTFNDYKNGKISIDDIV